MAVLVINAKAPLSGRLTPPATLAQRKTRLNMKEEEEEAHALVQLAIFKGQEVFVQS